jgi:uncharacterized protein (DUF433 family)
MTYPEYRASSTRLSHSRPLCRRKIAYNTRGTREPVRDARSSIGVAPAGQTIVMRSQMASDRRTEKLIRRYVELDPDRPSKAEARLKGYGVNVWVLAGYLRAGNGLLDQAARDYHLPREAVEAALAYYRRHRALIDDRIAGHDV